MIGVFDLINQRRSVRAYQARPVAREMIEKCLEAARLAPSACNSQPWSFIVVDNEQKRAKLAQAAFSGIYSMNSFAANAPVLVAVVTERSKFIAALGGKLRGVQYSLIDIGIACAFFSLAAEAQGLGSCLLGWFDEKAVKQVLGLPRGSKIDILISLGYPAENPPVNKTRKPASEVWRYAE
jgi:nitroreductase